MNVSFKIVSQGDPDAIEKSWRYDAESNAPKGRVDGKEVNITDYRFVNEGKSIVEGYVVGGAEHGKVIAECDYYYVLNNGKARFVFYDTDDTTSEVVVSGGSAIKIPKGTCFNYFAIDGEWDVEFVLFRDIVTT